MESIPTRRFTHLMATLAVFSLADTFAGAATTTEAIRLQLRPDAGSAVIGTLAAGSTYTPLTIAELGDEGVSDPAHGWVGIRYSGPYFGFAENEAVAKDLVLRPASLVYALPNAESPVVHTVGENESVDVIEPAAGWVKVVFRNERVVFFNTQTAAVSQLAGDPRSTNVAAPESTERPTVVPPNPDETAAQLIRGYLLEARPIWRTGHKFGYQLVDEDNQRLALLDFSALLQNEPIENFKSRLVEVYGARIEAPEIKDIVIRVETLRLAGPAAP